MIEGVAMRDKLVGAHRSRARRAALIAVSSR
jgi:hypothetical protein